MNIVFNNRYYKMSNKRVISDNHSSYEIGDRLGRGGNAAVYECIDSSGNVFAIKFLFNCSDKTKRRFEQEIDLLKKINHPHIIKYIDRGSASMQCSGSQIDIPFLIMEKAEKNLLEFIRENPNIEYKEYAPQFRGLSEALKYIHQYAIHRDLKPENILIKGEKWFISDFGLCKFYDEDHDADLTDAHEKIGPKYWMSPEEINRIYNISEEINAASDVFQLCMIFWFVVNKRQPVGVVDNTDWTDTDKTFLSIILCGLSHNFCKRPQNGDALYQLIYNATINNK